MERNRNDPPAIISWASAICGITGTPIYVIIQYFFQDDQMALIIGCIVFFVAITAGIFILREQNYKNKRKLEDKDREIENRDREIENRDREIEINNKELEIKSINLAKATKRNEELEKRVLTCKKAITVKDKQELTPVDYYLIDKDIYDSFKTDLRISECILEVEIMKKSENLEKMDLLKFKWTLKVVNDTSKPIDTADFIFSGLKRDKITPIVTTENVTYKDKKIVYKDDEGKKIKILGDDCFLKIFFADNIRPGGDAIIHINYDLKYNFNRINDYIWLVPDALGFACMDKFQIRIYSDGDIIREETTVELKNYKLDEEFTPESLKGSLIQQFDNEKKGFEVTVDGSRETLQGYGFQLELKNDI